MAEVEQATAPEKPKTDEKEPKAPEKKKGLNLKLIIIVVVQLFLAGGGFFVVTKLIKPDPALQMALGEEEEAPVVSEENIETQIYLLEDLIVNPAGTKGSRYLSVSVGVEMKAEPQKKGGGHGDSDGYNPLDERKPQLRDALINILSAKTIMQLTTVEEKERIRQEILEIFRQVLDPQPVYKIYFVDFVLQ
jgi:flagellar FliL protein